MNRWLFTLLCQDAVMYKLQRAIDRGAASLDLSDAALQWLPQDLKTMPEPARITDINLADNDLFNGKCKPLRAIGLASGPCQVLIQPTFAEMGESASVSWLVCWRVKESWLTKFAGCYVTTGDQLFEVLAALPQLR
jgi:hypothetical protein